jgi:hypothetical protein
LISNVLLDGWSDYVLLALLSSEHL